MSDPEDIEALEFRLGKLIESLNGQDAAEAAALGPYVLAHRVRLLTTAMADTEAAIKAASDRAQKDAATATRIAWVAIAVAVAVAIATVVVSLL